MSEQPTSLRNEPNDFLAEGLGGLVAAHPQARWDTRGFVAGTAQHSHVAVVSGGGSGHEPLHAGFVGEGMLDCAVPGLLFTSPNAAQIAAATQAADRGAGVVHIVKNYTGDVMNFSTARAHCPEVRSAQVLVAEDIATADEEDGPGRRGTAATILVEKVAGAAAERGDSLDEVVRLAQLMADSCHSMAVALQPGHLPTTGRPTFDLDGGQMEVGVGIHGERGTDTTEAQSSAEIAKQLVEQLCQAGEYGRDEEILVLVNGLGSATDLELGVLLYDVLREADVRELRVRRAMAGSFVTSVNMHGASVTFARLTSELTELIDAPTTAPAWVVPARDPAVAPARMDWNDALPASGSEEPWLSAAVEKVTAEIDNLTELDRTAGDGDFGANMEAALGDVELPLRGNPAEILEGLAQRFFVRAGGTSGAVFGTLCSTLARELGEDPSATSLATGLKAAADAITTLGGAEVGDRTMIDALVPAASAAERAAKEGLDFEGALAAAGDAALKGAEETAQLQAKKGRASYLGERSKGVVDPGALVTAWFLKPTAG